MTWWNFYFQIFEKSIGKEEVVEFLMHLLQSTFLAWLGSERGDCHCSPLPRVRALCWGTRRG
jgi:hypothetical protein